MLPNNSQDYFSFELVYKLTNESHIKLFDSRFVNRNKDKCKIIYNGKEYKLTEYFKFDNNNNNKQNDSIKIQLRTNNNITNLSCMFNKCEELLSVSDVLFENSNININKSFYENNSNSIEEYNNSDKTDKTKTFYNDNLTQSTIQKNTNSSVYTKINDVNYLKEKILSNVTDMSQMFYECSSLISLPDLSKWDTKMVTNMNYIFYGCSSLMILPDISKWDIKNVSDMRMMFYRCSSLMLLPDISKWDTKNVTDMSWMFNGCSSLISLPDISKWAIKNIIHMNYMFNEFSSLISLPDISKWDTKNIDMNDMFNGCYNLLNIHN